MEKTLIIIPGCCDLNRGDQALGWETAKVANDCGYIGTCYLMAEQGEPIEQSISEGFKIIRPILEHPSRFSKNRDNINYSVFDKIRWGCIAFSDLVKSLLILKSKKYRNKIIISKENSDLKETLLCFENSEAVFMKGGGLIQSHGGIISTYATYYRVYHILLANAMGKEVYIMPNSFGPFKGLFVKKIVKSAMQKCKLVTARENKSKEVVKNELNIDIDVFPDLAFYLENGNYTKEDLLKLYPNAKNKKIVAITMRPYRFPNSSNPEKAYMSFKNEMRNFIEWLYDHNFFPLIVEHVFALTTHESDGNCIKEVVDCLDTKKYGIFSNRNINCKDLKSVYSCCDYIVGTRFHSLIFSLSNFIPGIAISYDGYKSIGIMNDMKLGKYVIDISEVNLKTLIHLINDIQKNEDKIKNNISNYLKYTQQERNRLIEMIKERR